MTKSTISPQALARQKRAAAALKANLKRRKAAAEEAKGQSPPAPKDHTKRTA
jgi:hypothetical protein